MAKTGEQLLQSGRRVARRVPETMPAPPRLVPRAPPGCRRDPVPCPGDWRSAWGYRDVEALMPERGLAGDHPPSGRWVPRQAPALDHRCRRRRHAPNDSSRGEEPYRTSKRPWSDRYRAVEAPGATLACRRGPTRDAEAAEHFCGQGRPASPTRPPRPSPPSNTTAPARSPACSDTPRR